MLCGCARSLHAALVESDQLLAQRRFGDALAMATRALSVRSGKADLSARFRIVRAHSLWMTGRVTVARGEARRALLESEEPLTRARGHDALALFAWKDAQFADALALAESARRVYEARSLGDGLARSLQAEAGLLADRGQLEPAFRAQTRRVEALRQSAPERLGEALADRSTLLGLLGRWEEAWTDLEAAARVLRRVGIPGAVGLKRAALELRRGELGAARRLLDEARETERLRPSSPRVLADACLVGSDILLAAGHAEDAEGEAATAVRIFVQMADRGGECRARVRRAQSLLAVGRLHESIRESRIALDHALRAGAGIEALAALTLGRALLRTRPGAAPAAFDRAERAAQGRPDLSEAARLGRALASPGRASAADIDEALSRLERWGDRRLLGLARAEVRKLGGREQVAPRQLFVPPPRPERLTEQALVDAAVALMGEGEWPVRWARALSAVATVVPFRRAALVMEGGGCLEVRAGFETPRPLPETDPARDFTRCAQGPALFELGAAVDRATAPDARDLVMVAPVGDGGALYVERPGPVPRPEDALAVLTRLGRLLAAHLSEAEPAAAPRAEPVPGLVGRSEPMQTLADCIGRAASSERAAHVVGETGTGKERVARAIHDRSSRAGRPYVAVNAASLTDELLHSQLFGHARGAFSGAVCESRGLVEDAEGGTLFLDEIAELSLSSQARLLRFLQEGEYRRLGETRLRRANVRVVTAANVRLLDRVAAGRFREDLYYRLTGAIVAVPPLRDRGEDVLLLARHFLKAAADKDRVPPPRLPADVAGALRAYHWPGNVRELESEMGRLVLLARGRAIRRGDLSPGIVGGAAAPSARCLGDVRQAFEREHVAAALRRSQGNRTRAASDLGITRQALYDKIRRLGLRDSTKR